MAETQVRNVLSTVGLLHKGLKPLEVTLRFVPELAEPRFWASQEFFRGSFLTVGLRDLMANVAGRLAGVERPDVYELDAPSGGGKTHALLALYHMTDPGISDAVPDLRALFSGASVTLPEKINRVVIPGSLQHPRAATDASGAVEIKTLWGELAWQIGGAVAYEMVADHDQTGRPPGLHLLTELLSFHAPCLILADDLVSYVCHVGQEDEKSAWENLSFILSLTEAVRSVPRSVLVVSRSALDFSDRRAGDIGAELYKIFKSAERWKPASCEDMAAITRKRLCDGDENTSGHEPRRSMEPEN